jgi:mannose-6-phosphate isomerase
MLYPLTFLPIFKERIWGGRSLERLYHKTLPSGRPIGESWEITDRLEGVSVIANGPLAGKDLRWLMENHADELLGSTQTPGGRFPLLVKILDAQDVLSLQVHPPARVAADLGGEPKTEMWYIADATPGAELFAGLKRGVTVREFESRIQDGTVAACIHRLPVRPGDAMFLPSGRVHAIGAGLVIFEIQQNSDTTYRVFDWNRKDPEGKPRQLHVSEAIKSIDFNDFEPALIPRNASGDGTRRTLVSDTLFGVKEYQLPPGASHRLQSGKVVIVANLTGEVVAQCGEHQTRLQPGQFCLIPASLRGCMLQSESGTSFLTAQPN